MSDTLNDTPTSWPCRTRRLTPDEVLIELRRFCADMMGITEDEVARTVVPAASVRTLHDLAPDLDWIDFGPYFGLDLDQSWWDEWKPERNVSELCHDLARRIEVPVFEPVRMLGRECETAGAFLAIRNMLAADGANVRKLGPSSPLAPHLRRHRAVFGRLRLSSGGRLPHLEVTNRSAQTLAVLMLSALVTLIVRGVLGMFGVAEASAWAFALVAALMTALGVVVIALRQRANYPADFRQLVFTLLGRKPRTA